MISTQHDDKKGRRFIAMPPPFTGANLRDDKNGEGDPPKLIPPKVPAITKIDTSHLDRPAFDRNQSRLYRLLAGIGSLAAVTGSGDPVSVGAGAAIARAAGGAHDDLVAGHDQAVQGYLNAITEASEQDAKAENERTGKQFDTDVANYEASRDQGFDLDRIQKRHANDQAVEHLRQENDETLAKLKDQLDREHPLTQEKVRSEKALQHQRFRSKQTKPENKSPEAMTAEELQSLIGRLGADVEARRQELENINPMSAHGGQTFTEIARTVGQIAQLEQLLVQKQAQQAGAPANAQESPTAGKYTEGRSALNDLLLGGGDPSKVKSQADALLRQGGISQAEYEQIRRIAGF